MKAKREPWMFVDTTPYVATKHTSVDEKRHLTADLVALFRSDLDDKLDDKLFTKDLYRRLSGMFGFIAHFDRDGFANVYLRSARGKANLLHAIETWTSHGDPAFTLSDVERAVQVWVRNEGLTAKAQARADAEDEAEERALYERLKAKFEGGSKA